MPRPLWKKGERSPNPKGRPKGSQNKAIKTFRELLAEKITIEDVLQDLAKCTPAVRANLKIKLLEFAQPKLKSIEISEVPLITQLIAMTRDERKGRLMELQRKLKDDGKH
jgi:hypothetical protein